MTKKRSGRPIDYLKHFQRDLLRGAIVLLVASGVAVSLVYRAIYIEGSILLASIAVAVFLFLGWSFYCATVAPIKIALYFEEPVSGNCVWSEALASHRIYLDRIVANAGVHPLSFFGFGDDYRNEPIVWHAPEKGLETVSTLLQKLRNDQGSLEETRLIIADLEKMEIRLYKACENTTRFCFIFHSDGINGMEIEQRRGHF